MIFAFVGNDHKVLFAIIYLEHFLFFSDLALQVFGLGIEAVGKLAGLHALEAGEVVHPLLRI